MYYDALGAQPKGIRETETEDGKEAEEDSRKELTCYSSSHEPKN